MAFKPIGTHAVHVLAHLAARNEVKQQLRDQAIRPSSVKTAEISERALEEARTFAQNASDTALIELAHSFRIESGDGIVNEHWSRQDGGWKLLGQTSES